MSKLERAFMILTVLALVSSWTIIITVLVIYFNKLGAEMKDSCNRCDKEKRAKASSWCRTCQREYAKVYRLKHGKRKSKRKIPKRKPALKIQPKGTHRLKAIFVW